MNTILPNGCRAILIGCGAEKRAERCAASDLYTSSYFKAKLAFARSTGMAWAILSAQYGLLHGDTVIDPYEKSMDRATKWQRREWAAGVALQIFEWQRYIRCIAIIAGDAYMNPLAATLSALDVETVNPCHGLGIGQQLAWLKNPTPRTS